jgi:glucosamine--fructose-6-phosphate aminotransferase (isomerizing)
LTNDLDSPLAAGADALLPLRAGPERSVAATKTYLCSLHAIAQLAACLSAAPGVAAGAGLSAAGRDHDWFERLPDLVSRVVEEQLDARSRFDPLDPLSLLTVVGRGLQLATAHETALKVRELAGMATEAFSVPDLMHGPVAGLSSRGGIWLVSTHGRAAPDVPTLNDLRTRTGLVVAVADHEELLEAADIAVRVPDEVPDWVAPIVAVLPGQVAALRLGELRGVDLDRPHALSKVTLTR